MKAIHNFHIICLVFYADLNIKCSNDESIEDAENSSDGGDELKSEDEIQQEGRSGNEQQGSSKKNQNEEVGRTGK